MGNSYERHMEDLEKSHKPNYYAAVVVISNDGKVLLGKRKEDGKWTSPAGGAEPGEENPAKTAVRELFEEAGIPADYRFLQPLSQTPVKNGKTCHVYLHVVNPGIVTSSKLDPDEEVGKWKWFSIDEIPNALKEDKNRFNSVRDAYMKFHNVAKSLTDTLEKGRPAEVGEIRNFGGEQYQKVSAGIWKPVVHKEEKQIKQIEAKEAREKQPNPKDKLAEKLKEKTTITQAEKHLNDLKNQAVVPDKKTRSEKPMYTKVEHALADNYTLEDFREAGNFFYDRALKLADNIEMLRNAKQEVDPHFIKLMQLNSKISNSFIRQASAVQDREKNRMKKSVVMMGQADAAEVNTGSYSMEHKTALESGWLDKFQVAMEGYQYGEEPRQISLDKGTLYLVKVDDGMYTGLFKNQVNTTDGQLVDNAKIRIERMTLPSLVQFCLAKEYISGINQMPPVVQRGVQYAAAMDEGSGMIAQQEADRELKVLQNFVADKLSHKDPCPGCDVCQPAPSFRDLEVLNRRIEMLQLINKLLS